MQIQKSVCFLHKIPILIFHQTFLLCLILEGNYEGVRCGWNYSLSCPLRWSHQLQVISFLSTNPLFFVFQLYLWNWLLRNQFLHFLKENLWKETKIIQEMNLLLFWKNCNSEFSWLLPAVLCYLSSVWKTDIRENILLRLNYCSYRFYIQCIEIPTNKK